MCYTKKWFIYNLFCCQNSSAFWKHFWPQCIHAVFSNCKSRYIFWRHLYRALHTPHWVLLGIGGGVFFTITIVSRSSSEMLCMLGGSYCATKMSVRLPQSSTSKFSLGMAKETGGGKPRSFHASSKMYCAAKHPSGGKKPSLFHHQ